MIFTKYTENEFIFNEAESKKKVKNREDILRDAGRYIKAEIGSTIAEHASYRTNKDYNRKDFIEGKCEFVTVVYIKKSAEPHIGQQHENAKAIFDILTTVCNKVNKKLPDGCSVDPHYKGSPHSDEWDGWYINLTIPKNKNEFINESYTGGGNMNNSVNVLAFSGNSGGSYMHDALYESYVQAKIDAEDRLALALKEDMLISEADYSNIKALHEAKLGDNIKSKWKKFVAFIKGLIAKFMESMTNLLLDEKDYLEKYKDIILKKTPKDDMEYSYTGNYQEGIKRLINTEIPMFDYYKYQKALEAEDESDLVNAIMSGKNFNYNDGETLPEQFKGYFLALEDGQQEGKFSSLKMVDIYNFCYNFNKIKGIVDKDISRLEASTRAIETAINKELNSTGTVAPTGGAAGGDGGAATSESFIFTEADGEEAPKNTGLKISKPSTDAASKMTSTQERDKDAENDVASNNTAKAKEEGKEAADITKAADRWINVCRSIISAKLTACQQIAKDYMDIIRAHVRSYGGTDKKSKEGNTSAGTASTYQKDADKAKAEAERAASGGDGGGAASGGDKPKRGIFKRNK